MRWDASRCANMHRYAITDGIKMCRVAGQVQGGTLKSRRQCQKDTKSFVKSSRWATPNNVNIDGGTSFIDAQPSMLFVWFFDWFLNG